MRPALTLVTLGVADLQRSLVFYRDGLGWTTKSKIEDGVIFFQLNGLALALWPRADLAKDAGVPADGSGFRGIALAHNTADEAEVDSVLAQAKQAGATVVKPGAKTFWGGYSGYFSDPDGHLWEVAHNPFWTLQKDGSITI